MLKNLIIAAGVVSAGLLLAACPGRIPGGQQVSPIPAPIVTNPTVRKIVAGARSFCGFVPTDASVLALLSASPYVTAAGTFVRAICSAASTIPLADGPGPHYPIVNGVVIEGRFVRR